MNEHNSQSNVTKGSSTAAIVQKSGTSNEAKQAKPTDSSEIMPLKQVQDTSVGKHSSVFPQEKVLNVSIPQADMQQPILPQATVSKGRMPQTDIQQLTLLPQAKVSQNCMPQTDMQTLNLPKAKVAQDCMPQPVFQQAIFSQNYMSPANIQSALPHEKISHTYMPQTSMRQSALPQAMPSQNYISPTSIQQCAFTHDRIPRTHMPQADMRQTAFPQADAYQPAIPQVNMFQPMQQTQPVIPSRTSIMSSGRGAQDSVLADTNFTQGFVQTQIGRHVKVDFLLGTNMLVDREGVLVKVGTDYIIIQETDTDDYLLCDIYSIKFIRFYY